MASSAAGVIIKKTTGLTGMAVAAKPHHTLSVMYGKILRALQQMPSDAAYRKYTEQVVNERFQHVKNEPDVAKLEKLAGCGQVEELIIQAENELVFARKMLEWKGWDPLIKDPPANQWKWPI